jgi:hypothetical protein
VCVCVCSICACARALVERLPQSQRVCVHVCVHVCACVRRQSASKAHIATQATAKSMHDVLQASALRLPRPASNGPHGAAWPERLALAAVLAADVHAARPGMEPVLPAQHREYLTHTHTHRHTHTHTHTSNGNSSTSTESHRVAHARARKPARTRAHARAHGGGSR